MKLSIQWHRDCLKNSMRYVDDLISEIKRKQKYLDGIKSQNIFLATQINEAIKKGYDGFNDSIFMKTRRGKI